MMKERINGLKVKYGNFFHEFGIDSLYVDSTKVYPITGNMNLKINHVCM